MSSDRDILFDYFFASRYISRFVRDKYGLNPTLYHMRPDQDKMKKLTDKLSEHVQKMENLHIESCQDLKHILGKDFEWVDYEIPK